MSPLSDEHEALSHLLLSPGWELIIKRAINQKVKALYDRIIDPAGDRKDRLPDDYIRGYIAGLRWVVSFPEEQMNAAVANILKDQEVPESPAILFGELPKGNVNG